MFKCSVVLFENYVGHSDTRTFCSDYSMPFRVSLTRFCENVNKWKPFIRTSEDTYFTGQILTNFDLVI